MKSPDFDFVGEPRSGEVSLEVAFRPITSDSLAIYDWWFAMSGDISTQKNPKITFIFNGTSDVELIAYDTNNCSDTLRKEDYIQVGINSVGAGQNPPELYIYPNPVKDFLSIKNLNNQALKIELLNMHSQLLKTRFIQESEEQRWNLAEYESGTYFIKASKGGEIMRVFKVMKM